ncbi:MAG: amino acid ABC transporter substrate-binding protein [Dechloromonas sp.]|uniref:Amino acid ABC transporter substrate-binding protein n=1 Tax=Candidatus Dechloromonas phosphorivorans TaxID=2899244 RepID=A0A9D7LQX7_9RHOO|nr:amino acid ABC transporter substrate-binding protein [Candidatus Dechloromonas phosphorivorans]
MKRFLIGALVAGSLFVTGAIAESVPNTLGKIKAAKVINVAYAADSLPFSFVGPDKAPAGYSIDLCKRVIARIGQVVGNADLKVQWIAGSTAERLQMVRSGKADLDCANTTQTLGRLANVDFSSLIFIDAGGVMIRADSSFNSMADLAGKKIAVLKDTTTEARLNAIVQKHLVNTRVVKVGDANEALAMLESGGVDAYAGDKIKLVGLAAQAKDPAKFVLLAEEISFEPYAMALPRGDAALRLEVNRALTQVYLSDDIETIFGRWLGVLGRPTGLLSAMYLLYSIPE